MDHPIVFLDMDGVLNSHDQHSNGYCGTTPAAVMVFNEVLRQTEALIVISSAWRYMVPEAMTLKGFEYLLLTHGVECKDRILDVTCRDEDLQPRGLQIRHWLNEHGGDRRYVVLDDLDLGITEHGHPFVQTDSAVGLRSEDGIRVVEILTGATHAVA